MKVRGNFFSFDFFASKQVNIGLYQIFLDLFGFFWDNGYATEPRISFKGF